MGSKAAYQSAPIWKEFSNIVEGETPVTPETPITIFTVGGLEYRVNEDGISVHVSEWDYDSYHTYPSNLVIPETVTYKGTTYTVTGIGYCAFWLHGEIKSVTIPNTVTYIGSYAFQGCGLTSVTIPNSVTDIAVAAFAGNSLLSSVTIPNSVSYIEDGAFDSTPWFNNQPDGLVYAGLNAYKYKGTMPGGTSIAIREGTKSISGSCFNECRGLTSVTIPNSVTIIGDGAFNGCSGLTSITIPNSVTLIGCEFSAFGGIGRAFYGCSGLESIVVESGNSNYDSRDNCNAIIETATNTLLEGCNTTIIPNSVTEIGSSAFYGRSNLTSVTIPNSVTIIGDGAFNGCSGLTTVTIGNSVTTIGNYAFSGCSNMAEMTCLAQIPPNADDSFRSWENIDGIDFDNCKLYVPAGTKQAYSTACGWKNFKNIIEIGGSSHTGDVTGDGKVDVNDVNTVINIILGKAEGNLAAGDVTGDGKVDIGDVNAIINKVLGK